MSKSPGLSSLSDRRTFLVSLASVMSGTMVSACGGGGSSPEGGSDGNPVSGGGSPPGPRPVNDRNTVRVSLSAGTESNYPLQFGRPFATGEIKNTPQVLLDGAIAAKAQVDIKSRYADGSVKFAVVSLVLPTLDSVERVITFADHSPPASTAVSVADMLAEYDFEATITVAHDTSPITGSPVSARAMLQTLSDAALAAETDAGGVQSRYWTRGPVCTTVILCDHVNKSFDLGSTAIRAIRPMFHVQFWPGIKKYHVRHIVEVADVTKLRDEKGLTLTFATGRNAPEVKLSQSAVNLFLGTWQSRAWWGGAQVPRANVKHGVAYLAETKAMPNYDARVSINAGALDTYRSDWLSRDSRIAGAGYWQKGMATTGGRPDIGLMPKWDAVAMYAGVAHMDEIGERSAELSGSWAFFFREGSADKTLVGMSPGIGRIVSKLSRPTAFLYDGNGQILSGQAADRFSIEGTVDFARGGWTHDHAHTPGLYWWQYISTGQAFWHEKLLQLGAWSQFLVNPAVAFSSYQNGRTDTDLILNGVQMRGFGWQIRNRARSWWASLSGSPEEALFRRSLEDAVAMRVGALGIEGSFSGHPVREAWDANHLRWFGSVPPRPRPNALGYMEPRTTAYPAANFPGGVAPVDSDGFGIAGWQMNFVSLSLWHAVELGFSDAKELAAMSNKLHIAMASGTEPRHIADYVLPAIKTDGTYYQSLDDLYDGYAHDTTSTDPVTMPFDSQAGFPGSGPPNTYSLTVEGYGPIAAAALAVANGADGQAAAWRVVLPWYDNCQFFSHDPRYAIVPRA